MDEATYKYAFAILGRGGSRNFSQALKMLQIFEEGKAVCWFNPKTKEMIRISNVPELMQYREKHRTKSDHLCCIADIIAYWNKRGMPWE